MNLPIWTALGKVWLSVSTVNPFERFVTLYSGALSVVSNDLWLCTQNKVLSKSSCRASSAKTYLLSVWLEWVVSSHSIGVGSFVHSVENSVEDSRVRAKSSLNNNMMMILETYLSSH